MGYSSTMETVYDILEALENDNSRNYKEEVLRRNRGNDLLKRVFIATSDPYVNYFISKFKMPPAQSSAPVDDDKQLAAFLDVLLPKLSSREVVGNEAKALVNAAFQLMDANQQKWCLRILLRNLRVGVMETTINKVWPGAIAKFSVQLAESLGSRHEAGKGIVITDEVHYPVRVEPKLDGLRCIAIKHSGVVTMFTRSGSAIETLPTIKAALESAPWDDFVLDAEVMGSDWNESASVVMSHKTAKNDSNMKMHVFDAMSFDEWHDQESTSELTERVELVKELVSTVADDHVVAVEGKTVSNQVELMTFYSKTMEKGYEGIMLKSITSPYVFKRSDAVLKLKPVTSYEGVVVGHYEGNRGTKREGLWGGFQVLMPNGVITKCGGGFNDKQRAEIGIDPDAWIGRVIELEGQPDPLTTDGLTADGRIRFPVFIRERDPRDVDPKVIEAYKTWKNS
jgi:ATP dependent DNA ligase domain/DNA ligase N terminus